MTLLDRHVGFVRALREAGVPVSPAEGLDAARALGAIDLTAREFLAGHRIPLGAAFTAI